MSEDFVIPDEPTENSLYNTCNFANEQLRYQMLESLSMLDTSPEAPFDKITKVMSNLFKTPVSLITLVADPSRVWFKSSTDPSGTCVARDGSWCNYILVPETPEVLITEDATKDARFAHNPFVAGEPYIKFYAAAPLIGSQGERYGTLCISDVAPRAFTAELYSLLINFAALAVEEIERNKPLQERISTSKTNDIENNRYLDLSLQATKSGIAMLDLRLESWPIKYANQSFEDSAGLHNENTFEMSFWAIFEESDKADLQASAAHGGAFDKRLRYKSSGSSLLVRFMPAISDRLAPSKATGIPGWVPSEDATVGCKLGLDIDTSLMHEVSSRDMESVPDSKCFWFAVVIQSSVSDSSGTSIGSANAGSSLDLNRGFSTWSDNHSSGFGDYTLPSLLPNIKIGPLLGTGSFGKVYRGWVSDHAVAIKIIDNRGRAGNLLAMSEETELSLVHCNIVRTLSHGLSTEVRRGQQLQVAWIVQELCDMGTLSDAADRGWLRESRSITASPNMAAVLRTLQDIAYAMDYVHKQNIIHADLTGRNVLLSSSPCDPRGFIAKVCDFGMARLLESRKEIETKSLGTITHMPPEVLIDRIVSPAGDVWAFGVLAWEAYHGKCVFKGKIPAQIVLTVASNRPLPWPSTAPAPFVALMARCLSFEASERATFGDVVLALGAM